MVWQTRIADRKNVYGFLKNFDEWVNKKTSGFGRSDFYVINAIGASVKKIKAYNDLDLLLITNKQDDIREQISQVMEKYFKFEPVEYEGRRKMLGLCPNKGSGKNLHLIIDNEWTSEDEFDARDADKRIVIYRKGDTSGYTEPLRGIGNGLVESPVIDNLKMQMIALDGIF